MLFRLVTHRTPQISNNSISSKSQKTKQRLKTDRNTRYICIILKYFLINLKRTDVYNDHYTYGKYDKTISTFMAQKIDFSDIVDNTPRT